LFLAASIPVQAQVYVGGSPRPEVEVDRSVLDQLGAVPTLPDMLLGRPSAARPAPMAAPLQKSGRRARLHQPGKVVLHRPAGVRGMDKAVSSVARRATTSVSVPAASAQQTPKASEPPPPSLATASPLAAEQSAKAAEAPSLPPQAAPETEAKPLPEPAKLTPPAAEAKPEATPAPAPAAPSQPPAVPPPQPPAAAEAPQPAPQAAAVRPAPAPNAAPPLSPPQLQAPAPAAPPQEARVSPPPAVTTGADGVSTILFEKDGARLPDEARESLIRLAGRMDSDPNLQVQLLAYAEGDEESASKARRLSLSRALNVRSFLIDQGVRSTRIEVRALGNKVTDGSPDRVDVLIQKR
jgi:outer membrane protein OmpA-like peptidoglycan-associated protein